MTDFIVHVDPNATGSGDGSTEANAYTSLNAAEAAKEQDLTAGGGHTITFLCHSSGAADADDVAIEFGLSWTTGAANPITIIGEIADDGIWSDDLYRIELDAGNNEGCIAISVPHTTLQNCQVGHTGTSGFNWAVEITVPASPHTCLIDSCIVRVNTNPSGIYSYGSSVATIRNTVIYGTGTTAGSSEGIYCVAGTINATNCTIYNVNDGVERDSGTCTATNCLVFNCGADEFDSTTTCTNCVTDDARTGCTQITTSPDQSGSGYAALVTNAAGYDFSITDTDSKLYDNGSTPTATDITGYTWVTDDIGAFAWQAAASGSILPKKLNAGLINNSLIRQRLIA
jgi:hypothetical protein